MTGVLSYHTCCDTTGVLSYHTCCDMTGVLSYHTWCDTTGVLSYHNCFYMTGVLPFNPKTRLNLSLFMTSKVYCHTTGFPVSIRYARYIWRDKNPSYSTADSSKRLIRFFSLSPAMVTSLYRWNILKLDIKQYKDEYNQSNYHMMKVERVVQKLNILTPRSWWPNISSQGHEVFQPTQQINFGYEYTFGNKKYGAIQMTNFVTNS